MTGVRSTEVRNASIRVALAATAIVGLVYVVISAAVVGLVTRDLTSQVDRRLSNSLDHMTHDPHPPPDGFKDPDVGPRFDPTLLVWTIRPDGSVVSNTDDADLPPDALTAVGPTTITLGEYEIRIRGGDTPAGWVVVGQSTRSIAQARQTVILAELVIAPILLLVVFLGAVAIGRRVAAPIEQARVRQLEFTADASHELRTPLSVIEAHTSLALAQPRDTTWYRKAFERVDVENKRMRRLLEDLLWLARFDSTRTPPNAEPVDVGVLARETADRFHIVAEARGLSLDVRTAPGDHVVTVPPEWLDRLLGVLLDNACKYSPRGATVVISVADDGGRVRLTVDDAGPGIPEEDRARIFDRFHRATKSSSGAGLGLAIADAIVRATGGKWRVGTSPAGGASMSAIWRRAIPPSAERSRSTHDDRQPVG